MKETFILCNLNELEFIRTLAKQNINTLGVRLFNAEKLAKEALIRNGVVLNKTEINELSQTCIIKSLMNDASYFNNPSFVDAKNLTKAINKARLLCAGNELETINKVFSDGEFVNKNKAILAVYNLYIDYLNKNNLIDSIGVINICIENNLKLDVELLTLTECKLEPAELKLAEVLTDNSFKTVSINNYFNYNYKPLSNITYASAYGQVNEIEYILNYIAENKIAYEDCLIIPLDSSYINEIVNYQNIYQIPVSYGTGLPICLSNVAKLLSLFNKWEANYNTIDSLLDIFNSEIFASAKFWQNIDDSFSDKQRKETLETVGALRLAIAEDNDKLINYRNTIKDDKEYLIYEAVEKTAKELNKGYTYLLNEYCIVNDEFNKKALDKIVSYLNEYTKYKHNFKLAEIFDELLNQNIQKELSRIQTIHVTSLNGAFACLRKHIFICGLNAQYFPGSPSEDYLLLDSDLKRFNLQEEVSSNSLIIERKKQLIDFICFANNGSNNIHLSFSDYDLSDLKVENPSSMAFEIYKLEKGNNVLIEDFNAQLDNSYRFFSSDISSLNKLGNKYLEGYNIKPASIKEDEFIKASLTKAISPSSAELFFGCAKRFYLHYVLKIDEPEDNDPFKILPANDEGTLIHECMEDYGKHPNWTKDEFMANANNKLNDYFKRHIPLYDKNMPKIKKDFLLMAENGFTNDPHNEVVCSEYYFKPVIHEESGLAFAGIVDRIEKLKNGNYLIVDYKTYKDIRNVEDDIESCLQVIIYAYLFEKTTGHKVEGCEYRYLRNTRVIKCIYNEAMKKLMDERLIKIKQALDSGIFNYASDNEACKYCKYKNICGVNKTISTTSKEVE